MYKLGVIGCAPHTISAVLRASCGDVSVTECVPAHARAVSYDLLIINGLPARPYGKTLKDGISHTAAHARTMLVNSDYVSLSAAFGLASARLVITYGLNSKACVTASSVADGTCTVCVQRAFTALDGSLCVQQEFTVALPADTALPAMSALLAIAGQASPQLCAIL